MVPYFVFASNQIIQISHMPSSTSAMDGDSKILKTLLPYLHGTVLHEQIPKKHSLGIRTRWRGGYPLVKKCHCNVCTVDNLLYILHLAIKRRPGIKTDLIASSNNWIATLLQVHDLFEKNAWSQGKFLWLNTIGWFKGTSWDTWLEDMAACQLDFLMSTEIV